MPAFEMTARHQWQRVENVLITFTIPGQIEDEIFEPYLEAMSDPRVGIVFSVAHGSNSLTAVQRKQAAEVLRTRSVTAIVVTNNRFTRGIITAISWLGANVRGYSWDELPAAVESTGASPEAQHALIKLAKGFRQYIKRGPGGGWSK